MAQKKGRDWSEWKEHVTGMHRLDNGFHQRNLSHHKRSEATVTGISLRDLEEEKKEPRIWVWVLVFLGMLLVRYSYFQITKTDKVRSSHSHSRTK